MENKGKPGNTGTSQPAKPVADSSKRHPTTHQSGNVKSSSGSHSTGPKKPSK